MRTFQKISKFNSLYGCRSIALLVNISPLKYSSPVISLKINGLVYVEHNLDLHQKEYIVQSIFID